MFDQGSQVMWFEVRRDGYTERFMIPNPTAELPGRIMIVVSKIPGAAYVACGVGQITGVKDLSPSRFPEFPVEATYQASLQGHPDIPQGMVRYSKAMHEYIYTEVLPVVESTATESAPAIQPYVPQVQDAQGTQATGQNAISLQPTETSLQQQVSASVVPAKPQLNLTEQLQAQLVQKQQGAGVASVTATGGALNAPAPVVGTQKDLTAALKAQVAQQKQTVIPGPVGAAPQGAETGRPNVSEYPTSFGVEGNGASFQPTGVNLQPTVYGNDELMETLLRIEAGVVHLIKDGKGETTGITGPQLAQWFQENSRTQGWDKTFEILAQHVTLPIL